MCVASFSIYWNSYFTQRVFAKRDCMLWQPFYTSMKSWRCYIFTAVCLCVCVCVCLSVCLSVCPSGSNCEQNSSQTNESIWTQFSLNGWLPALARTTWKLVTLGQRSRSQWRNTHFFHNSMLTFLLSISALLCSIEIKFNILLRYTQTIVHISYSIEAWTYKLRTLNQYTTT